MGRKVKWPGSWAVTWRQLRRRVRKAGGELVSTGSSEVWRLPDGQRVKIDACHPNVQVRKAVAKLIYNAIKSQKTEVK